MKFYIVSKLFPRVIPQASLKCYASKNKDLVLEPDSLTGIVEETLDDAIETAEKICGGELYYWYYNRTLTVTSKETDQDVAIIVFVDTERDNTFTI